MRVILIALLAAISYAQTVSSSMRRLLGETKKEVESLLSMTDTNPGRLNCQIPWKNTGGGKFHSTHYGEILIIEDAGDNQRLITMKALEDKQCAFSFYVPCSHGKDADPSRCSIEKAHLSHFPLCTTKSGTLYETIKFNDSPSLFTTCASAFTHAVIYSDWDDTIAAAGGGVVGNVAGKDRTLSHGSIYPGVLQLYKEVSGQFIILSANPSSSAASKNAKILHSQIPDPPLAVMMFGGSVLAVVRQMGHGYEAFAEDKTATLLENTNRASSIKFAGRKIFFFGDNGQGDMIAAINAIETNAIHYGMIRIGTAEPYHQVDNRIWPYICDPKNPYPINGARGCIFFFKNYLQAGYIISKLGINGLDSVWFEHFRAEFCDDLRRRYPFSTFEVPREAYWHPKNPWIAFPKITAEAYQKEFSDRLYYLQENSQCQQVVLSRRSGSPMIGKGSPIQLGGPIKGTSRMQRHDVFYPIEPPKKVSSQLPPLPRVPEKHLLASINKHPQVQNQLSVGILILLFIFCLSRSCSKHQHELEIFLLDDET